MGTLSEINLPFSKILDAPLKPEIQQLTLHTRKMHPSKRLLINTITLPERTATTTKANTHFMIIIKFKSGILSLQLYVYMVLS